MIGAVLGLDSNSSTRRAWRDLKFEWRASRLHRSGMRRARRYAKASGLKLNCGCGPNSKSGWVNLDLVKSADLRLDLRRPIPLPDGCAAIIYSEHFLEHLDFPDCVMLFLRESLRLLEKGGRFRVGVPDTEWPLQAYFNNDRSYFDLAQSRWHPAWCTTRLHSINYHFRQDGEHKYAYDFETLQSILHDVGFTSVERSEFDESLDHPSRSTGTLYVNARKPE